MPRYTYVSSGTDKAASPAASPTWTASPSRKALVVTAVSPSWGNADSRTAGRGRGRPLRNEPPAEFYLGPRKAALA
eukprot:7388638-Prymnesium_polylepis.2